MSNQTPREQIEEKLTPVTDKLDRILENFSMDQEFVKNEGDYLECRAKAKSAILAVFKGLPAMQEEMAQGPAKVVILSQNTLRRQILAELEYPNGR